MSRAPSLPGLGRLPRDKPQEFEGDGSYLENQLLHQIREAGLPDPFPEHPFSMNKRRFRFDFAWPEIKLAVEIQGGVWTGGRHVRPIGFAKECEKRRAANLLGWCVLEYTGDEVKSKKAVKEIEAAVTAKYGAIK